MVGPAEEGETLLQRIEAGDPDDSLPNRLLKAIFAGYPLERLRVLLGSPTDAAAEAAAWILSELGPSARPLLGDAAVLLGHDARKARFFALDIVLTCADEHDGEILAKAIELMADPDPAIQWKAMRFLTALPNQLIEVASQALTDPFDQLTKWIIDATKQASLPAIQSQLRDVDATRRRFAAVAFARSKPSGDLGTVAAESPDPVVRDFLESVAGG